MNTIPGATALSLRAFNSIEPRRVVTRMRAPGPIPSRRNSAGARLATASGSISSKTLARRVIAPVVPVFELAAGCQHIG